MPLLMGSRRILRPIIRTAGVKRGNICAITFGYRLLSAGLFCQSQLEYYGTKVIPVGPGELE